MTNLSKRQIGGRRSAIARAMQKLALKRVGNSERKELRQMIARLKREIEDAKQYDEPHIGRYPVSADEEPSVDGVQAGDGFAPATKTAHELTTRESVIVSLVREKERYEEAVQVVEGKLREIMFGGVR